MESLASLTPTTIMNVIVVYLCESCMTVSLLADTGYSSFWMLI